MYKTILYTHTHTHISIYREKFCIYLLSCFFHCTFQKSKLLNLVIAFAVVMLTVQSHYPNE